MNDDVITAKAREIAEREATTLVERTPASARLYERASRVMPYGVASSFQANDPYPIYAELHAHGPVNPIEAGARPTNAAGKTGAAVTPTRGEACGFVHSLVGRENQGESRIRVVVTKICSFTASLQHVAIIRRLWRSTPSPSSSASTRT
jgi:hypothetical protein